MNHFAPDKFPLLLLTLFLLFNACSTSEELTQTVQEDRETAFEPERPIPYPIEIPLNYQSAIQQGTRTDTGEPGDFYWQNEASYQLQAELLPEENRLNGSAVIEYSNNSPYPLEQLVLELTQNLHKAGTMKKENTEITGGIELQSFRVQGEEVDLVDQEQDYGGEPGYLVDATRLLVILEEPLEPDTTVELELEWTFEVPEQGASGRMGRSRNNLFFIGYWYPQIMVYDDVNGWFTDPFLGNAEFYYGFADYEYEVTLPDDWVVMGTGELLNPGEVLAEHIYERYQSAAESDEISPIVTEADFGAATRRTDEGRLTWKFSAENIRDVAFSATREFFWDGTRAAIGDRSGDGSSDYTRIHSFYRDTAPLWEEQAEYAQHSISFLSDYLNHPYPWPHMTSVEGAGIIEGGMEYPMITVMGDYNNMGAQRLYEVTAHEFAHMWYPMIVNSNERRYTWMDEGFTSFNTHQAMMDRFQGVVDNEELFRFYLGVAGSDFEGPIMRRSDFHYPGPAYGVASYPKPASVMTALREMLGEETFQEAYDTFMEEWAYKHPYPWDFFNTIERVAERDLEWFWRSWYYETWFLDQSIASVDDQEDQVVIEVEDIGNIPMPVFLRITLEDGTEVDAKIPVDSWLNGSRTASVTVETGQPVLEVVLDPDYQYPDVERTNNQWVAEES